MEKKSMWLVIDLYIERRRRITVEKFELEAIHKRNVATSETSFERELRCFEFLERESKRESFFMK